MPQKPQKGKARDLVYYGWKTLDSAGLPFAGALKAAELIFNQALALNPEFADAYNGLAIVRYEREQYLVAETMCRTTLEKARADLGTEDPDAFAWWGGPETRPYMRARHTSGLALWRQGKYRDAISEFQEMLKRNPNDNQGVRYLIGPLCHLSGDLEGAVAAYKNASRDPGSVGDPMNELSFAWPCSS